MNGKYALQLLQYDLHTKETEIQNWKQMPNNLGAKNITRLTHQTNDLKFAIELLEEYQD